MVARGALARALWALSCCLLAALACRGVLGIQERNLASEALPPGGYDGCRPGADCSGCILPAHRTACEPRGGQGYCDQSSASSPCGQCICAGCSTLISECQDERGCTAILACVNETRCQIGQSSADGCFSSGVCREVIQENGGLSGEAIGKAAAVRACASGQGCFSCLPPEPVPPEECSQRAGCQNCDGCFRTCLCTGDSYSDCLQFCSESPENCIPDGCQQCETCLDACSCRGGDFETCTAQCQPTCAPPSCEGCDDCLSECTCRGTATAECDSMCQATPCSGGDTCAQCPDCVTGCVCDGGSQTQCESDCASGPPPGCLKKTGNQLDQCEPCEGCLGRCTCTGETLTNCLDSCGYSTCNDGCRECSTDSCLCPEDESRDCVEQTSMCSSSGSSGGCSQCACDKCPHEIALCQLTESCPEIWECLLAGDCQDADSCADQCATSGGGVIIVPPALTGEPSTEEVVEALQACTRAECSACR